MATFGETLFGALVAAAPVTAIVNRRIFPGRIKQGVTMPAVRYTVVDDVPWNTIEGGRSRTRARVQVDAYAKGYLEAHALASAIEGAVGAFTGPAVTAVLLSKRDGFEDETDLHRVSLDFSMSMEVTV
jgi:hypothetical protein